jgi:hypothetical protein
MVLRSKFTYHEKFMGCECNINSNKVNITNPNTSDASQFHHPPHEPSCKAHQEPK